MSSHDGDAGAAAPDATTGDGGGARDCEELRRELERRERERAALVRRYERLLAERDERIDELRDDGNETLGALLFGLFDDRN